MNALAWWLLGVGVAAVAAAYVGRWLWQLGRAVGAERARELFRLQHERFEAELLAAVAATGKPRGLRWVSCQIAGDALLVRDVRTKAVLALVPVIVQFEPLPDSDMTEVPAAREPRPATAVFTYTRGTWTCSERIVFNHTPEETVTAFAPQFHAIEH